MNLKEIYKNMTDEEIKQRYNKKENYNIDEQKLIKREAEERLMIDDRINRIVRHRNMLRDFINISMKICFKMFYLFFIILMLFDLGKSARIQQNRNPKTDPADIKYLIRSCLLLKSS